MNVVGLLRSGGKNVRENGVRETVELAAKAGFYELADRFGWYRGESLMAEEWDCLIVLDACRVDALQEIANEYAFLPHDIPSRYSAGSASDVWLQRTFTDEFADLMRETVYVTANPNTHEHLQTDHFLCLDEVWRDHHDTELGTIPPRAVTDHAIARHREHQPDRLLIHYMQPHFPSIPDSLGFGFRKGADNPEEQHWIWTDGKPNEYSRGRIWESYIANLRHVLDDVELLLENLDCKSVLITADHGNAYGEWGEWGHPKVPLPVLRKVPDVWTTATDTESYTPEIESDKNGVSTHIEEKLSALGYKE